MMSGSVMSPVIKEMSVEEGDEVEGKGKNEEEEDTNSRYRFDANFATLDLEGDNSTPIQDLQFSSILVPMTSLPVLDPRSQKISSWFNMNDLTTLGISSS